MSSTNNNSANFQDIEEIEHSGFAGGDGSKENPYQISNGEELFNIRYENYPEQDIDKIQYFILINDIDLANFELPDHVPVDSWEDERFLPGSFPPIRSYYASQEHDCTGKHGSQILDGQEYTISNLTIEYSKDFLDDRPNNMGLFAGFDVGTLKNLNLENIQINQEIKYEDYFGATHGSVDIIPSNAGGLIGSLRYGTRGIDDATKIIIENCHVSGDIYGDYNTGGLIGNGNNAYMELIEIKDCSFTGTIRGYNNVGGLIGKFNYTYGIYPDVIIENCHTYGEIKASTKIGGLVGSINNAEHKSFVMKMCHSEMDLASCDLGMGGLIGYFTPENTDDYLVTQCWFTGSIDHFVTTYREGNIGGLIGNYQIRDDTGGALVKDCYAICDIHCDIDETEEEIEPEFCKAPGIGGLLGKLNIIEDADVTDTVFKNCYYAGSITIDGWDEENIHSVIGAHNRYEADLKPLIENIYYNGELVTYSDKSEKTYSRTTEKMTRPHSNNTYEEFDFGNIWFEDYFDKNDGYPVLEAPNFININIKAISRGMGDGEVDISVEKEHQESITARDTENNEANIEIIYGDELKLSINPDDGSLFKKVEVKEGEN